MIEGLKLILCDLGEHRGEHLSPDPLHQPRPGQREGEPLNHLTNRSQYFDQIAQRICKIHVENMQT